MTKGWLHLIFLTVFGIPAVVGECYNIGGSGLRPWENTTCTVWITAIEGDRAYYTTSEKIHNPNVVTIPSVV